ncbi:hypothetical protein, partial [Okeania sp. SIO2B3]|uniref:hypothetical protein n=1 Tax=Okeania sp. SIO2B3 TaxID=2607784 RepID=UPI0025D243DF
TLESVVEKISTSSLLRMPQQSNHFVKRITLECVVEKYLLPLSITNAATVKSFCEAHNFRVCSRKNIYFLSITYAATVKSFCEAHNFRVCSRKISTSSLLRMPQQSNHFVKRITLESAMEKYLLPLYCVCRNSQIIL